MLPRTATCLRQAIATAAKGPMASSLQPRAAAALVQRSSPVLVQQARGFVRTAIAPFALDHSPRGPVPADTHLIQLLGREVDEEVENAKSDQISEEAEKISEKIHKRFTVKDAPGSTVVKMHAKHGLEKIAIQFDVQDTTEDEVDPDDLQGEDADNFTVGVRGLVTVTKGHSKLIFSVVATNGLWVERVAYDDQNRDFEDDTLYWSDFTEYPEDVQEAFRGYLAERNINDELAVFVSYHAYNKEKDNYVEFLEGAKEFISS